MLANPTFWFLVSFILFFAFFGKTLWSLISGGLDSRSEIIENDIQAAMDMREQAQELLNEIKARQMESGKHAEAILEHARLEAERLKSEAAKELDEYLKNREMLVQQRIEFAENEALKDIRDTAVRMAIEASEKIIGRVVTKETDDALTDKAIEELEAMTKTKASVA